MRLTGRTIAITGGHQGIGLALAKRLAEENTVIIVGRNQQRLEEAVQEVPSLLPYRCDLRDHEALEEWAKWLYTHHPKLDILINNAAVQHLQDWRDVLPSAHSIEAEIQTNLIAPMLLTKHCLPLLRQQPEAAIVNITTGLVYSPKQSAPGYCASKSGLRAFTLALREQLKGTQVKLFELLPPLVDTAMTSGRGRGKISADSCAQACLKGMEAGQLEIAVGKSRILRWIWRLAPWLALRILRRS